jgi:hypothetical protein
VIVSVSLYNKARSYDQVANVSHNFRYAGVVWHAWGVEWHALGVAHLGSCTPGEWHMYTWGVIEFLKRRYEP